MGGKRHASATLPQERVPVPIVQEAGWASGPVWYGAENLAPTGFETTNLRARKEWLYRLYFLGLQLDYCQIFTAVILMYHVYTEAVIYSDFVMLCFYTVHKINA